MWPELSKDIEVAERLVQGKRPSINNQSHPQLVQLVTTCWDQNPAKRPTMEKVAQNLQSELDQQGKKSSTIESDSFVKKKLQHSPHLYVIDELMSTLQKSVRRSEGSFFYILENLY